MFRTLQHSPRVISLFSSSLENNRSTAAILQLLKGNADRKLNVQLDSKFPTLDQLRYMNDISPSLLRKQIPQLNELLTKDTGDPIFQSDLHECIKKGLWSASTPLWVDWEKKRMGNDVQSIEKLLNETASKEATSKEHK